MCICTRMIFYTFEPALPRSAAGCMTKATLDELERNFLSAIVSDKIYHQNCIVNYNIHVCIDCVCVCRVVSVGSD